MHSKFKLILIFVLIGSFIGTGVFFFTNNSTKITPQVSNQDPTPKSSKPLSKDDKYVIEQVIIANEETRKKEAQEEANSTIKWYKPRIEYPSKFDYDNYNHNYLPSPNNKNYITLKGQYYGMNTELYYGKEVNEENKVKLDFDLTGDGIVTWLDDENFVFSFIQFKRVKKPNGFDSIGMMGELPDNKDNLGVYKINIPNKQMTKILGVSESEVYPFGFAIANMQGEMRIVATDGAKVNLYTPDLKLEKTILTSTKSLRIIKPVRDQKGTVKIVNEFEVKDHMF
ncbi:MAG: hypothetical protein ACRCXZ_02430 [Patescibacteria group bacterium]